MEKIFHFGFAPFYSFCSKAKPTGSAFLLHAAILPGLAWSFINGQNHMFITRFHCSTAGKFAQVLPDINTQKPAHNFL